MTTRTTLALGTMVVAAALGTGCGAGPGGTDADGDGGGATTTGTDPGQSCPKQAAGTSGSKITATVSWPATIGVEGGTAEIVIWTLSDLTFDGTEVTGKVTPCGSVVPPIQTKAVVGGMKVQPVIPDAVWEAAGIPKTMAHGSVSGFDPGATISMDPAGAIVGVVMADPINDDWPDSWTDLQTEDSDGDGKPGITAVPNTSAGFTQPPLSLYPGGPSADELYLATRSVMELQGSRDSCTHASGTAVIHAFDNHVVGCRVAGGGACDAGQVAFVDANRVIYSIESASYEMTQVPAGASCADVRAALP